MNPANTPYIRDVRRFLVDAFIPHMVDAVHISAPHRSRLTQVPDMLTN